LVGVTEETSNKNYVPEHRRFLHYIF